MSRVEALAAAIERRDAARSRCEQVGKLIARVGERLMEDPVAMADNPLRINADEWPTLDQVFERSRWLAEADHAVKAAYAALSAAERALVRHPEFTDPSAD